MPKYFASKKMKRR